MRRATLLLIGTLVLLPILLGCGNETKVTRVQLYGESAHWLASVDSKYVETWTKNADGKLKLESNQSQQFRISWRGQDPQSVGTVTYAYESVPIGWKGRGDFTLSQQRFHEFGTGGNGAFPGPDAHVVLKVQWSGTEETLELKPKQ